MTSPINFQLSSSVLSENFIHTIQSRELGKSPQIIVSLSQMMAELQTTLATKELIEIFIRHLSTQVEFEQYRFSSENLEISVENSNSAVHTCSYGLTLKKVNLGTITFFRSQPFDEQEMEMIENHLATLIYPLRNAHEYEELQSITVSDENYYKDSLIFND